MLVTYQAAVNFESNEATGAMTINDLRAMEAELREDGVRLRNCELNTGKAKYAFSELQLPTLPEELRPPPGTFSGKLMS